MSYKNEESERREFCVLAVGGEMECLSLNLAAQDAEGNIK